jgi:hypothetical protein
VGAAYCAKKQRHASPRTAYTAKQLAGTPAVEFCASKTHLCKEDQPCASLHWLSTAPQAKTLRRLSISRGCN